MDAHDRVVVEERPRVGAVGADAAHHGREVDQVVRRRVLEQPQDGLSERRS